MIFDQASDEDKNIDFEKLSISTNTETNIGLSKTLVSKYSKPYSECELDLHTSNNETINSGLYRLSFERNKTYSKRNCLEDAYRRVVYDICNCSVSNYASLLFPNDTIVLPCLTQQEINCSDRIFYDEYQRNNFNGQYDDDCPLECQYNEFNYQISSLKFPSYYHDHFYMKKLLTERLNRTVEDINIKENVAKLNIYFTKIGYTYITEKPTMKLINVLANTGGMLGLFLGMSCISFIEILEIIYYHCKVVLLKAYPLVLNKLNRIKNRKTTSNYH